MWQTSFYLFGSIGMVWSLIWISLYSEKQTEQKDVLPLVTIPQVSYIVLIIVMRIHTIVNYVIFITKCISFLEI